MSTKEIGFFKARTGTIVICDAFVAEERWERSSQCGSGWVVDFTPNDDSEEAAKAAEYVSHVEKSYSVTQLDDGTWRATVPDSVSAAIVKDQADRIVQRDALPLRISCTPAKASRTTSLDATRKTGVGKIGAKGEELFALAVRPGKLIEVHEERGVDGKIRELRLRIVDPAGR